MAQEVNHGLARSRTARRPFAERICWNTHVEGKGFDNMLQLLTGESRRFVLRSPAGEHIDLKMKGVLYGKHSKEGNRSFY